MTELQGILIGIVAVGFMIAAGVGALFHIPEDDDESTIRRDPHSSPSGEELYRFSVWHHYHSDDEFDD